MSEQIDIGEFKKVLQKYADEREWNQFHSPKNLSMALSVEAGELMEIFQWLTLEESRDLHAIPKKFQQAKDEIADIFVYLVRLCGILEVNLPEAVNEKMEKNAKKYPIEKAKGNAKKYNEF